MSLNVLGANHPSTVILIIYVPPMSVLIEGLTLVIPRKVLDARYPGGHEAYLVEVASRDPGIRYAVADAELVAIGLADTSYAPLITKAFARAGYTPADGKNAVEMVLVDQQRGPLLPCPWLEWKAGTNGVTHAWTVGRAAGELAAPTGWAGPTTPAGNGDDERDEPGRTMPLGSENGLESWVDFNTGEVMFGLPKRKTPDPEPPAAPPPEAEQEPGELSAILVAAIESRGWRYLPARNGTAVDLSVAGDNATFRLWGAVNEKLEQLSIFVISPSKVPVDRRTAVAEFVARVNWTRRIGGYDFDFEGGDLSYKVSMDLEGGELTEALVQNCISQALWNADHYHNALQKVVFGGVEAKAALEGIPK